MQKEKIVKLKSICTVVAFLFAVCLVSIVNTSHSSAKVYSENNTVWGQLYEDYKTSGTGASTYGFYSVSFCDTEYIIPYYLNKECTLTASGYYTGTNGYSESKEHYSDCVYPAEAKDSRTLQLISVLHVQNHDHVDNTKGIYYTDEFCDSLSDFGFSVYVPVFETYSYTIDTTPIIISYYIYLATGVITDPSAVELPEGFTIDDGGKVIDKNEIVICGTFAGGGGEFGSVYKEIQSYGDEKTCLYLLDEIPTQFGGDAYGLYTESEISDYHREMMVFYNGCGPGIIDTTRHNIDGYSMCIMGGSQYMRGWEYANLFNTECYVDDAENYEETYYSIVPLQKGYIFTTSGFYMPLEDNSELEMWQDLTCTLIQELLQNYNPLFCWYLCQYVTSDQLDALHLQQASLSQADLTINRPIFSNYGVAKQWYSDWTVDSYSEIEYIPRGYYWHEETHILDKNPPTNYNEEEDENDEKHTIPTPKPPKSEEEEPTDEPTEEPSPSPVAPPTSEPITNTGGEIVINVTQSNDNTLTQDSHDRTNVYVTGGAVDGGGSDDSGRDNGYNFIEKLLQNPSSDSMIDVIGDALNDEDGDFFDILKHIFGFLPSPFLEFLSLGSVGAVIMRFLGR